MALAALSSRASRGPPLSTSFFPGGGGASSGCGSELRAAQSSRRSSSSGPPLSTNFFEECKTVKTVFQQRKPLVSAPSAAARRRSFLPDDGFGIGSVSGISSLYRGGVGQKVPSPPKADSEFLEVSKPPERASTVGESALSAPKVPSRPKDDSELLGVSKPPERASMVSASTLWAPEVPSRPKDDSGLVGVSKPPERASTVSESAMSAPEAAASSDNVDAWLLCSRQEPFETSPLEPQVAIVASEPSGVGCGNMQPHSIAGGECRRLGPGADALAVVAVVGETPPSHGICHNSSNQHSVVAGESRRQSKKGGACADADAVPAPKSQKRRKLDDAGGAQGVKVATKRSRDSELATPKATPKAAPKAVAKRQPKAVVPKMAAAAANAPAAKPRLPPHSHMNFVRQDLKLLKRKGSSVGTTKAGKLSSRYYNKNGSMKRKYTQAFGAVFDGGELDGSNSRASRFRHRRVNHLAETSLVDVVSRRVDAFSPSVTAELLDALPLPAVGSALGEIAERRPADAVSVPIQMPPPPSLPSLLPLMEEEAATIFKEPTLPPAKRPEDITREDLHETLQGAFGHDEFRPGQCEAVHSVLGGNRTLLLLATGAGKSLCYQLPAYCLREEGLTLVVSPLLSLMADQMMRLPGCLRGASITSQQTRDQNKKVMRAVRARLVDVLFISPERLSMWAFDGCGLPPIALACIDEAHCISEWSHNFRPDYLLIQDFLMEKVGARRLLALTATATRPAIKSVCEILRIDTIVRSDRTYKLAELLSEPSQPRVQRGNLVMEVRQVSDEDAQIKELVNILRSGEHSKSPALIYCWRKITVDQLVARLRHLVSGGVRGYHGGMTPDCRRMVQTNFMCGLVRVVVATMAFGMGLDKPDIRTVVHFNLPKSIENYIQETGRGSRDGGRCQCVALVNAQDFKAMRWMESGGNSGSKRAGVVSRILGMLAISEVSQGQPQKRYEWSVDAHAAFLAGVGDDVNVEGKWRPYNVAFDAKNISMSLNCPEDELHSVLAHLAFRAEGHVVLYAHFPTKIKLRFFKTDPAELAARDPFLGKILPLAKKTLGVHTIEFAAALALLGRDPGRLSNALWQAQGDDFSVEKAEYGYMLSILKPIDDTLISAWAHEIDTVNYRARENSKDKLDALFLAFTRVSSNVVEDTKAKAGQDGVEVVASDTKETCDSKLSELINAYFAASSEGNVSLAMAGSASARTAMMRQALGDRYQPPPSANDDSNRSGASIASPGSARQEQGTTESNILDAALVHTVVARLIMGSDWPKVRGAEVASIAHAAAQFLAGISSVMMPAKKWRQHSYWGKFRAFGDFDRLAELVLESCEKIERVRVANSAAQAAASTTAAGA